ncbi:MAG: DUF4136 domain-containing protein [Novosphingobium sp.]|nr:DUF4136 domain-containing protein [Novosphingobium sp.]
MNATIRSLGGTLKALFVPFILATLAACTQSFDARVSRFSSQLPPPHGETIAVVADNPALAGGIEFGQYAAIVADHLARVGYTPVANPQNAALIARLDYGVDRGRERIRSTGFGPDPFWGPWYGYGRRGWGGRGFYGGGLWGYGWYDPFFDNGVESYTVYTSFASLKIEGRDRRRLFEGKAEAVSTSNRLPYLVPNLVEALFTGFPGQNGETVHISIAPEKTTVRPVR